MKELLIIIRRFVPPYKKYLALNIIFNILAAFLTLFSFAVVIPILRMLFGIDQMNYTHIAWENGSFKEVFFNNFYYYTQEMITTYGPSITLAALAALLAIVICILILSSYLKKQVSSPLREITQTAMQLARGDLGLSGCKAVSFGTGNHSDDEIGTLNKAFENTVLQLGAYIGEITEILGGISSGDLTVHTEQEYTGDFVSIKTSLDSIIAKLNKTLGRIA